MDPLLVTVIVGGIAGYLASVIMHTNARQGIIMDIILGVFGAVVGSYLANAMGSEGVTGLNLYSILVATAGAAILIWIGRHVLADRHYRRYQ